MSLVELEVELSRGFSDVDGDQHLRPDQGSADAGEGGSWTRWAWNVGTSVGSLLLPVYWEDDDTDSEQTPLDVHRDKVFHVGFYVDSASVAFKVTERQKDKSLFGSTKLRFTPFLRLDLAGIVQEVIVKGVHTVNATVGVSEVCLVPVGDCLCGARDTLLASTTTSENVVEMKYVYAGTSVEGKKK